VDFLNDYDFKFDQTTIKWKNDRENTLNYFLNDVVATLYDDIERVFLADGRKFISGEKVRVKLSFPCKNL